MCGGATKAQDTAQQQQAQFYSTLQQQYSTVFGEDQGILTSLNKQLAPIIAAGPSQQGFSAGEINDLNTQADEQTGAGYKNADQALREEQAAQGGGNADLPSGANAQIAGELAGTAEGEDASEKNTIQLQGYQQGATNYNNALSAEEGVAGQLNPTSYAGQTTGAGEASSNTANQIAQQSNSVWTSVIGALGGVAGKAAGAYFSDGSSGADPSSYAFTPAQQANQANNWDTLSSTFS